jgi:hypothetical protein
MDFFGTQFTSLATQMIYCTGVLIKLHSHNCFHIRLLNILLISLKKFMAKDKNAHPQ